MNAPTLHLTAQEATTEEAADEDEAVEVAAAGSWSTVLMLRLPLAQGATAKTMTL